MIQTKKMFAASLVACMFALLAASAPVSAGNHGNSGILACTLALHIDLTAPDAHWEGPITGSIEGTMQLWEKPDNYVTGGATVFGSVEHYFEDFAIITNHGTIRGVDSGVWSFTTFNFRATGVVISADGDWAFLAGYTVSQKGTTSPLTLESTFLDGPGMMTLVPPE